MSANTPLPTDADIARLSRALYGPPVRKAKPRQPVITADRLAEAVKQALANERQRREAVERQVSELKSELAELRAEVAVQHRFAELDKRLGHIEGRHLRSVG